MAFEVGALSHTALAGIVSRPVALDDEQKKTLRDELLLDPMGRGYAELRDAEALRVLCAEFEVPNPAPTTPLILKVRSGAILTATERNQALRIPDSQMRAKVACECRCDVLFGGLVPSLEDIAEARA